MIETEQVITIDRPIGAVWDYVRDIARWAGLMPGLQDCSVIDENDSAWTVKVGAGGLVRTVKVKVHVDAWEGPERVRFSYRLEGDPVEGGGSYLATAKGPSETEVALRVRVVGGGAMAPMWEAMGRPLLPQLAKAFAGQLKAQIEQSVPLGEAAPAVEARMQKPPLLAAVFGWLRSLFGSRSAAGSRLLKR